MAEDTFNGFADMDAVFSSGGFDEPGLAAALSVESQMPDPGVQEAAKPEPTIVTAPAVVASTAQTSQVPANASSNKGVADDFEIGLTDSMVKSLEQDGITVGDIGIKVSRVPIEKYRASSSKVDRIAFITSKVIPVKFHYIEGVGSILCNKGKCCDVGGTPTIRYLFPICVYQTDNDGNITGGKVELKILSAGEDFYKNIQTIAKAAKDVNGGRGGIDRIDLMVTCSDDQYQKISLTYAGAATWRRFVPIADFLKNRWMADGDKAYMAVARKVDDATLAKLLKIETEESPQQTFDALANADLANFFAANK